MTDVLRVSIPTPQLADDVGALLGPRDDVELIIWPMENEAPSDRLDIVVPPYMSGGSRLHRLEGVATRLVQVASIGYDGIAERLPAGMRVANASSVHEASTAELALALILASQRDIPKFVAAQAQGEWVKSFPRSLADRRVLVLGYGGVGKAIAARLTPFEVEIVPVASRSRTEEGVQVHGIDELGDLLPDADILVAALPGGDRTRGLVGDAELAALPDGALVVNVGRGTVIDTDALTDHVGQGRIRAALDVVDPEPLPADHPLWRLPGVLIAPHVGGASSAMRPRMARLVADQVERMRRGDPPRNIVIG